MNCKKAANSSHGSASRLSKPTEDAGKETAREHQNLFSKRILYSEG